MVDKQLIKSEIEVKESFLLKTLLSLRSISAPTFWSIISIYLIGSLILAIRYVETNIFSGAGGIVTIYGVLIMFSISTPLSVAELKAKKNKFEEENRNIILRDQKLIIRSIKTTVIGTVIWAYGWLLEGVF